MKTNFKRILSIILAIAVLAVSLPLTLSISAEGEPEEIANLVVGNEILNYDFSKYSSFDELTDEGFIYGGTLATPALSFGYGSGTTTVSASIESYNNANHLYFNSQNCDALLLAPAITETNYVYEATFIMTTTTPNVGTSNLSWGDEIGDVKSAVWMVGRQKSEAISVNGKASGLSTITNSAVNSTQPPTGTPLTFKIVCYNGVNYYFYNDQYIFSLAHTTNNYNSFSDGTGGRVGFYTYGGTMYIQSMTVNAIGEPVEEEITYWDGSFGAALPTTDADGDGEIEITTPEEFAAVASSTGLDTDGNRIKYELTKDIWLNDTTQENWKDNAKHWIAPVEDLSTATVFNGIINGNGYVVRGMYINTVYTETNTDRTAFTDYDEDYSASYTVPADAKSNAGTTTTITGTEVVPTDNIYAGLFPVVGTGAGFIGLGVEDSYISLTDKCEPITVTTTTADGVVTTATYTMNRVGAVGALVGVVTGSGDNSVIIDQCYASDTVELTGVFLGLVGKNSTSAAKLIVSNSYATCVGNTFNGSKVAYKDSTNTTVTPWDNHNGNRFMLVSGGSGSSATVYSAFANGGITNNGAVTQNVGSGYINVYCTQWAGDVSVKSYVTIKGVGTKNTMPNLNWELFTATDSYPTLNIFTTHTQSSGNDVWNGTKTDSTATDTDNDGYVEVYTAEQLAYAISNSVSAELMNDIWLNDISVYAKGGFYINNMNRAANTWLSNVYSASFNGNGNVVHGVFYNTAPVSQNASTYSGLIPSLGKDNSVEKVGVEDSYIRNNSHYSMGAVAGYINNGTLIDRCYAGETVYVEGYSGVGGITGGGSAAGEIKTITNCYSLANVVGSSAGDGRVGGIIGNYWTANVYTIKYCYTNSAELAGNLSTSVFEGTYATAGNKGGLTTAVTSANMMGDNALTKMSALNGADAYVTTMSYPILKIFDPDYVEEEEVGQVWNGSIAGSYAGGSGTEADPYIISKGSQLALAVNSFGSTLDGTAGAYFKLDRDIYLNDVSSADWADSAANSWFEGASNALYSAYNGYVTDEKKNGNTGTFNGNIDGNGFHIYGLYYADGCGSQSSALLPVMSGGTIQNLGIDHVYVYSSLNAAVLAADTVSLTAPITVDKCYIGEDVHVESYYIVDGERATSRAVGGFFGYARGTKETIYITISNSYALFKHSCLVGGQNFKMNAFVAETWDTHYKLENVFSVARPIDASGIPHRGSNFCEYRWTEVTGQNDEGKDITVTYAKGTADIASIYKNVYTIADVDAATDVNEYYEAEDGTKTYAYTNLDAAQMRGSKVFNTMTINGDGAFVANIGYPSLALFGHTVPDKATVLDGYDVVGAVNAGESIPTTDFYYTATLTENTTITTAYGTYKITVADGSAKVEIYHISNFDVVYVDDVLLAMTPCDSSSKNTTLSVATGEVQLLVGAATFNGVTFDGVQLQLADRLGNTAVGSNGFKLNATLTKSEEVEALGYPVEYGVLMNISSEIVEDATEGLELSFDENGKLAFELTGLSIADKEKFYNNRGFAKITIADGIEYYYYAPETEIFSPVYVANTVYKNGTDEQKTAVSAIYGGSDKFVWDKDADSVTFTLMSDSHYKEGMYMTSVSDMQAIAERAYQTNSDFILSGGDFSNDFNNSLEFVNAFLQNKYNLPAYNIYGNHELETNGNSMSNVTPLLTNQTDNVVWGTASGKIEDGSIGYYYFEQNGMRFICIDNNYSWDAANGVWEHIEAGKSDDPSGNTKKRSLGPVQMEWFKNVLYDAAEQGTPCVVVGHAPYAREYSSSSQPDGAEVKALFKKINTICGGTVLMCINGHYHTDSYVVEDDILYLDMNTTRNIEWLGNKSEFLTAHYSIDITEEDAHVFDFVAYDINGIPRNITSSEIELTKSLVSNVVYNSETEENTFTYTTGKYMRYVYDETLIGKTDSDGDALADENGQVYATDYYGEVLKDADGNSVYKVERLLASLSQSPNTWFASTPLSAVVTIDSHGNVNVEGSGYDGEAGWIYGAVSQRSDDDGGAEPNYYYITGKVTSFSETVGYAK